MSMIEPLSPKERRHRLMNPVNGRGSSDERTEIIPPHVFERRRIEREATRTRAIRLRDAAAQLEEARNAFADFHHRCQIEQIIAEHAAKEYKTVADVRDAEADEAPPRLPLMVEIQRATCEFYGVTLLDVLSQRREARVVLPRQVGMYLCKELTLRSLPEIGRRFGGRDHTTCLHAIKKVRRLLTSEGNRELADEIAEIKRRIET